eukprot:COSAG01_NODE_1277_length_10932_cov_18.121942_2_plen_341_part_00
MRALVIGRARPASVAASAEYARVLHARSYACEPTRLLVYVMVGCPVIMNVGMLWIQDQFLAANDEKVDTGTKEPLAFELLSNFEGGPSQSTPGAHTDSLHSPLMSANTAAQDETALEANAVSTPDSKVEVKRYTYRDSQRKCLRCCCGSMGLLVLLTLMIFFTWGIGQEQCYYDHCYVHVRVDSPTKPLMFKPGSEKRSRIEMKNLGSAYTLPHNYSRAHTRCTAKVLNADDIRLRIKSDQIVWLQPDCPGKSKCRAQIRKDRDKCTSFNLTECTSKTNSRICQWKGCFAATTENGIDEPGQSCADFNVSLTNVIQSRNDLVEVLGQDEVCVPPRYQSRS